jgi:3-oxoadipate enol-lactonase
MRGVRRNVNNGIMGVPAIDFPDPACEPGCISAAGTAAEILSARCQGRSQMRRYANSPFLGHDSVGHGPQKVIVLHDWHGDRTTYDPILPYLDRDSFQYAFADLPGYGASCDHPVPAGVEPLARAVLALADGRGWRHFHLVGHSLSAMIAQCAAMLAPERVASLTAVCPLPASGSPADDEALAFFAATAGNDDAFRRLMRFLSGPLADGWIEAKRVRSRAASVAEVKMAYLDLFRTDFSAKLAGAATRANLILGDRDPGLDAATMAPLFGRWYADLAVATVRNCGHYPMEEAPPGFAAILEQLLVRQARAS